MTQENLKAELREILTEFGATSPTRDWSPSRDLKEIQQEVIEHREVFLYELLNTIKQRIEKKKYKVVGYSPDSYWDFGYNACLEEVIELLNKEM